MANADLTNAVRAFAAGLPEAWDDHPWGESVIGWIEESHRLVAPKRLAGTLGGT